MSSNDCILAPIAENMINKLDNCDGLINSTTAELALILDPRFGNDILGVNDVLHSNVTLLDHYSVQSETPNEPALHNFYDKPLDDDSLGVSEDEDIILFLSSTSICDKRNDSLFWCKTISQRFPSISSLAQDVLSVQVSSVSRETFFSEAGKLADGTSTSLNDSSISALVLIKS